MATPPVNIDATAATGNGSNSALGLFNLRKALANLKGQPAWRSNPRSAHTLIKDQGQRIVLVALHAGEKVAPHQASGPISVQMLEGRMKFITPLRTVILEAGDLLTLQARIRHQMEAAEDSAFLLTLTLEESEEGHPALSGRAGSAEAGVRKEIQGRLSRRAAGTPGTRVLKEHRRLLPLDGKPVSSLEEYQAAGGLTGLRRALALSPDQIIEEIKNAGLRGRGGAGFPTGSKWAGVLSGGRGKWYACCNGAEGEPGTFKDRYLLRMNPYLTIEGLAIAAHTVGADRAFFCIKRSFRQSIERLRRALDEFNNARILPTDRESKIELVLGPEEYLFGEEKAMLEVIEGNLPLPRWLPPYVQGLFCHPLEDNPTLVNNVETLADVALILRNGHDWFRETGTVESPGTMIFTVCGDVQRPGCYELPMGSPLGGLVNALGGGVAPGRSLKAIFSGVSNGVLTPDYLEAPMDFDSMRAVGSGLGSGGFIVYDDSACILRAAALFSRFLYVESCGQCPPCKFSSGEITGLLERLLSGRGSPADLDTILARCATVDQGNRCALPTGERHLITSLLDRFREEFRSHCSGPCTLTRDLIIPKLVDYDPSTHTFTYDEHQHYKQPDWSYARA